MLVVPLAHTTDKWLDIMNIIHHKSALLEAGTMYHSTMPSTKIMWLQGRRQLYSFGGAYTEDNSVFKHLIYTNHMNWIVLFRKSFVYFRIPTNSGSQAYFYAWERD